MTIINALSLRVKQLYYYGAELEKLLVSSIGFSFCLLIARIAYTGKHTFLFLVWNLLLAGVPYLISLRLDRQPIRTAKTWKLTVYLICWLLFIPNSFYMLTDMFHLYDSGAVPYWYDLLLIFSFAWNALLLGILSVRHIEKFITWKWNLRYEWLFVFPVMWLNAVGVYIGRYLRFNSWDVISNPFYLMRDMAQMMLHPFTYKNGWSMILCFSLFLTLFYATLKKLAGHCIRGCLVFQPCAAPESQK